MDYIAAGFDPAGTRFAAVYSGLDTHRVRVAAVDGSLPPQDFALDKGSKVTSLAWMIAGASADTQPHKRRRRQSNGVQDDIQVCLGTAQGAILLYSPANHAVVSKLVEPGAAAANAIVDLAERKGHLWALHADGKLAQWDVTRHSLVATMPSGVADARSLSFVGEKGIPIVASTSPHALDFDQTAIDTVFSGFATPVEQLLPLGQQQYFAARAADDRQVLVYKLGSPQPFCSLMCPSTNAIHLSTTERSSEIAVTTEDGRVHLFVDVLTVVSNGSKRSKIQQHAPSATICLTNGRIVCSRMAGEFVVAVSMVSGSVPVFTRVQWQNADLNESRQILGTAPEAPKTTDHLVQGQDPAAAPLYKDQHASVASGNHMAALESSDEEEDEEETLADRLEALEVRPAPSESVDGSSDSDNSGESDGEDAEHDANGDVPTTKKPTNSSKKELRMRLSQPGSFAVLLQQALKLSDKQLLELCLEERDEDMIKASIVKLDPPLAAELLEKLAATMARSENRNLVQWIKWVMIIHGGYLVTVPNLLKTLAALHSTMSARVATLPRLLALQGRLELLDAQIVVRREAQAAATREIQDDTEDTPELVFDEESVIVNGEEDLASEASDDDAYEQGSDGSASADSDPGSEAEGLEGFDDMETD